MKVIILSVSVPDLMLPEEIVPAINNVLSSHPHIEPFGDFFVRILDAYLVDDILERQQKQREVIERALPPRKKRAS